MVFGADVRDCKYEVGQRVDMELMGIVVKVAILIIDLLIIF